MYRRTKVKLDIRSSSQRDRHFEGFFNVSFQAPMRMGKRRAYSHLNFVKKIIIRELLRIHNRGNVQNRFNC